MFSAVDKRYTASGTGTRNAGQDTQWQMHHQLRLQHHAEPLAW